MSDEGQGELEKRIKDRSAVTSLAISGVLVVLVLGAAVVLLGQLAQTGNDGPEAALSLVFVATAVVLILVVCTLTIVFKRLQLTDAQEAMGLPKGSVRSVIALLLIMLFFIAAIFLFHSTKVEPTEARQLTGITSEQFAKLPADEMVNVATRTVAGATVYDVTLAPVNTNTTTSDDLAKQLVTTVATLVTAVAAFYFGANSVSSAHKEARTAAVEPPTGPVPAPAAGLLGSPPQPASGGAVTS
jgi:amino acid transporter